MEEDVKNITLLYGVMIKMYFSKATPVWGKGLQEEMNITCGFYTTIENNENSAVLKIATSGFYRLYINGEFIHHGPVRTAHGYYRVDEIPISENLKKSKNHIAVEVVNYYVNSYAYLKQPGFVQIEIASGDKIIAATDDKASTFKSFRLLQRIRKIQRYSFQRPFAESYRLSPGCDLWRIGNFCFVRALELEQTDKKAFLPRELPIFNYPEANAENVLSCGNVFFVGIPKNPIRDRSLVNINEQLGGFTLNELELKLSDEMQGFNYTQTYVINKPYIGYTELSAGEYQIISMPSLLSGFPVMNILCEDDATLYFAHSEVLSENGDVDGLRAGCVNVIRLDLKVGNYDFQGFEPIGFKYVKLICTKGKVKIKNLKIREAVCAIPILKMSDFKTAEEKKIVQAAINTFRQNAYDLFTDCPTRERAGWLCDSYFIGRMENFFTGSNLMEKQFLENFLLPEKFEFIPDGMLPCCYPADHYNGDFIPNWAMWYALELIDYYRRTGDSKLVILAKAKMEGLIKYFEAFENSDGLLENLEGWVFVEWSKANDLVQNVNFPTNMTYAAMLRGLGELYRNKKWCKKSELIADTIRRLSYNGEFFVDNQIYQDGVKVLSNETTETCQYYAFFFNIATPTAYPELWKKLITDFGPQRSQTGKYKEVWPSNAFIGNYLRLDILLRNGIYEECYNQIIGYFSDMVNTTGTLWEYMESGASCCHGFASYVAYLLYYSGRKEQPKM